MQLLSRHWIITDADSGVQEVRGEGVVGEQPLIALGKSFRTIPAAPRCHTGRQHGGKPPWFDRDNAQQPPSAEGRFQVPIPVFFTAHPTALH